MAAKVSVNIDQGLVDEFFQRPGSPLELQLTVIALQVQIAIVKEAPKRTGRLAGSVRKLPPKRSSDRHQTVSITINIGNSRLTPYLGYVLNGTPQHAILPIADRPNPHLRFIYGGQVVFARRVLHPGTRANDFVSRGLERGFRTT